MRNIGSYLRFLNIDIAFGACANCYLFQWITGTELSLWVYILLFNSIWAIYTLDRIFDVGLPNFPKTDRHFFHKRNHKALILLTVLLLLINLWILLYVDPQIIINGLILALLILTYLLLVKFWKKLIPKEILIALFYTSGVSLGALTLVESITPTLVVYFFQHALLAFLNLLVFSDYELGIDRASGQFNLAQKMGLKGTFSLKIALVLISLGLSIYSFIAFHTINNIIMQVTLLSMLTLLFVVGTLKSIFQHNNRYRIWADAAFFIPIWIYFI